MFTLVLLSLFVLDFVLYYFVFLSSNKLDWIRLDMFSGFD